MSLIHREEPITRGRGNPHIVEMVYRHGGEPVFVSRGYPRGLSRARFAALPEKIRQRESWTQMVRDAAVYAKGAVRHRDHATVVLPTWHRVEMNTEQRARAMRHVAFLD